MHDVVEMLLTRIKDYPEDFVRDPDDYSDRHDTKWQIALRKASSGMTVEEKQAVDSALEEAKRAIYMGAALKTIMSEEVREEAPVVYTAGEWGTAIQGALGIAQGSAQQAQRAQLEYQRMKSQSSILNALNSISFLGQP